MPREPEPWGGDVRMPEWLRRVLRRRPELADTPERVHERRQPQEPTLSVAENVDRAIFGGFSPGHPGNKAERHRH